MGDSEAGRKHPGLMLLLPEASAAGQALCCAKDKQPAPRPAKPLLFKTQVSKPVYTGRIRCMDSPYTGETPPQRQPKPLLGRYRQTRITQVSEAETAP